MKGAYSTKSSTVGGGSEGEGGETREITLVLQEIHGSCLQWELSYPRKRRQ